MRCVDPVLQACLEIPQQFRLIFALKQKQILYCELFVLIPSESQPLKLRRVHRECLIVQRRWVEQVIDLLAVYLEERHRDGITTCGFELGCLLV